ncbi:MAG: glycosyltransferase [Chloroflexota bacterium]
MHSFKLAAFAVSKPGPAVRLKLIEAMAAGKAIVSTPVAAEGFPVQYSRHLLLAGTAAEFATAVLHLLYQPIAGSFGA